MCLEAATSTKRGPPGDDPTGCTEEGLADGCCALERPAGWLMMIVISIRILHDDEINLHRFYEKNSNFKWTL